MKSQAAILVKQNHPLEIVDLEVPPLKKGQVLVKIAYSGFCHTQLNEWSGKKGADPYMPHTLGHEGSGVVLEVGDGVTKVKPNDRVILSWLKGEGHDVPSTKYLWGDKEVNSGAISTFLEKAVISENRLIPIPPTISLKKAALLGCAIPTGAGVIINNMKLQKGQSLAIFGVGGIGLSALLAAKLIGATPLIAVDLVEQKLTLANEMGATEVLNAKGDNLVEKIRELTCGGVDFSLECAGKKEAMENAFKCIRPSGGLAVLAGNLPKGEKIEIDPFDLIIGKKIIGTWGGDTNLEKDIPRYIELFFKDSSILTPMISHEMPLSKINDLIEQLRKGTVARGLISFSANENLEG